MVFLDKLVEIVELVELVKMVNKIRQNSGVNTPVQRSKAKTDLEVKSTFQCISLLILGNVTAGTKNLSP
jgi:hypothetical protein